MVQQDGLDLRREDVDPPDDEHIVRAAHGLAHFHVGAAAGTLLPGEHTDVPGAVAQQGEGLLGDGGEHQLPLAPLGEDLAGVGVDDLSDEVVLVDMHTRLGRALEGYAGAGQLGQAIDVVGFNPQGVLDVLAHLLRPCLRAEDARLQGDLIRGEAHLLHGLSDVGGVGGGAAQDGGLQILDEHNLPLGIARGGGDGETAHPMGPAVQAGAAGEQAIAVGHLAHVLIGAAGGHDGPGAAVLPQVDVVLGVEGHHPLAGGARGGLDAHALLQGLGYQPVGVGLPQVGLGDEGQLVQVVAGADVVRGEALLLHLLAVVGHIVPDVAHLLHKPLILPGLDLFPGRALDLGLVVSFHWNHSSPK